MCETTDLILKMAHEGKSRLAIREALGGIGRIRFNNILEAIGDVKFYKGPAYTVRGYHGTIKDIIDHFKIRISCHTVAKRMSLGYNLEDCFFVQKYGRVMTLGGFTGSTLDIIKHFNLDISVDAVSKRLQKGSTIENAFLDPIEVSRVRLMNAEKKLERQAELREAYTQPLFPQG